MINKFIDKEELLIINNFVSPEEEHIILNNHKSKSIKDGEKRNNIQRYGSDLPYKGKIVSPTIPRYFQDISERLVKENILQEIPDSVSVNEYGPGQLIKYHIDSKSSGQIITIISLLGQATMGFKKDKQEFFVNFPARALLQISGELRYNWKHCILPVTELRYSIVFRNSKLL
jgi:alkylated DNA repair dioxygenase AlkB